MVRIIISAGFFAQPAEHLEHNRLGWVVYAIKRRMLAPGISQIIRDRQIAVGLFFFADTVNRPNHPLLALHINRPVAVVVENIDRFAALLTLKQQVCAANDCLALGRNNLKRRDPVNINIWHKNDVASRARADIIHVKRSGIVGNRLTNNDVGLGQLAAGFVFVKRSPNTA